MMINDNELQDVVKFADELFCKEFNPSALNKLMSHSASSPDEFTINKISDSELESILVGIPLEIYQKAECLSNFKLKRDIIKQTMKDLQQNIKQYSSDESLYALRVQLDDNRFLCTVYDAVIQRSESLIAAAKEYLMVCKKLWDRRREIEKSVPIAERNYELPDYIFNGKSQTYVK